MEERSLRLAKTDGAFFTKLGNTLFKNTYWVHKWSNCWNERLHFEPHKQDRIEENEDYRGEIWLIPLLPMN